MSPGEGVAKAATEQAQALWTVAPGKVEIRSASLPQPGADDIVVRALVSGMSRGTEALVLAGLVPESEWQRMRCPFQEGDFPFPVKYGYAAVGEVEQGPPARLGQRVLCLHPHQTRFVVPAAAATPLPDTVPTTRAALGPQMETALNACWDGAPKPGQRIAVVGAGVIGALVAYVVRQETGDPVTLIDKERSRASLAAALGLGFATPDGELPRDRDLVFHASGQAEGLDLALELASFEATVIELSWYGSKTVPLHLGGAFHSRRLTLRSSQVGHVAPSHRGSWTPARRLAHAVTLLSDDRLDALLDGETPFAELPAELPAILARPGTLCHLVRYPTD